MTSYISSNASASASVAASVAASAVSSTSVLSVACGLRNAARDGDYKAVAKLLRENQTDVDSQNRYGDTALHYACRCGFYDIVRLLIEKGHARTDIKNDFGRTPKFYAELNDHDHILQYLSKHEKAVAKALECKNRKAIEYENRSNSLGIPAVVISTSSRPVNEDADFDEHWEQWNKDPETTPNQLEHQIDVYFGKTKIMEGFKTFLKQITKKGQIEKKKILQTLALDDEDINFGSVSTNLNRETNAKVATTLTKEPEKKQNLFLKEASSKKTTEKPATNRKQQQTTSNANDRKTSNSGLERKKVETKKHNFDRNKKNENGEPLGTNQYHEQLEAELDQVKRELQRKKFEKAQQQAQVLQLINEKEILQSILLDKSKQETDEINLLEGKVEKVRKELKLRSSYDNNDNNKRVRHNRKSFDVLKRYNNKDRAKTSSTMKQLSEEKEDVNQNLVQSMKEELEMFTSFLSFKTK